MNLHPLSPPVFPMPWANEWGEDEYGLWMAFSYQGQRYAFRWIPPGSFTMGSPEDETGRSDNETQQGVTFAEGFWMGEFPVTQGLYQAVTGDNPSHFNSQPQNELLPVETVNWQDAQAFIQALNQLHPDLNVNLPLECMWEYACRAGTQTPFWFGDQLDLSWVNYDGQWGLRKKNESDNTKAARKQTNPAGDYPPNPWGLFDMHGNVFEWCLEPWQDTYPVQEKPVALKNDWLSQMDASLQHSEYADEPRFSVRGGCWGHFGRGCRSAFRLGIGTDDRHMLQGFRLALGPEL
ncbi:formylglycine-generating enzyme family protein [Oceanospirillum sediminis]|uniref:Formylglycine-generating enzyme family protein n=1 Tax=Oceanospirillum sediminis TaxID=2760088 RepID=A0A839INT8_9GAMM|nr:formylglycine-generating enzyme family protein [Oceanospirillum sediminis]MBB1487153.1 formylglycine-generating enzyme family protein [Oceanospirillum sediminis]